MVKYSCGCSDDANLGLGTVASAELPCRATDATPDSDVDTWMFMGHVLSFRIHSLLLFFRRLFRSIAGLLLFFCGKSVPVTLTTPNLAITTTATRYTLYLGTDLPCYAPLASSIRFAYCLSFNFRFSPVSTLYNRSNTLFAIVSSISSTSSSFVLSDEYAPPAAFVPTRSGGPGHCPAGQCL